LNRINQLTEIHQSGKPYIIYKSQKGFDLYTDFSKKIILSNKNIESFLSKKNKRNLKNTDIFIGFFGYELLNNLIDIKVPNQTNLNFPKGIFYKPEKKIKLSNKLNYNKKSFKSGQFKININKKTYTKIFNKFQKKIKSGET
jgi:para-aminobenzoate synthetase component 1